MTTFTIWHGAEKPMRAVGIHQSRMLRFAEAFRGWHTAATDKATQRALGALVAKGYLETNPHGQFRFTYPAGAAMTGPHLNSFQTWARDYGRACGFDVQPIGNWVKLSRDGLEHECMSAQGVQAVCADRVQQ